MPLPKFGRVFVSTRDADKPRAVAIAAILATHGLSICATRGTAADIGAAGVPVEAVRKVSEGADNITDAILAGEIAMVINTPSGGGDRTDGAAIRHAAIRAIPCITTIEAAEAVATALGTTMLSRWRSRTSARSTPIADEVRGWCPKARTFGKRSTTRRGTGFLVCQGCVVAGCCSDLSRRTRQD